MSNVSFSDDQFRDLLEVLASRNEQVPQKSGSFASCTARFNGTRNTAVVEAFLSTISTYKKIEAISNDNAIEGLTLLLTDEASIWWLGLKEAISNWQEAVSLIRTTFAPKRPAYLVYDEMVCDKQKSPVGTELFVAKKRALMAELPKPSLTPSQGLDLLYTSLHITIRDRIPRDTVTTFEEFLAKVRQIEETVAARAESNLNNISATPSGKRVRCTFCRAFGHPEQECRKKAGKDKTPAADVTAVPIVPKLKPGPAITCYGCGEPGVVRSKCPKCTRNKVSAVDVGFYSFNCNPATAARLRPTVKISIAGVNGQAHIDSGAKLSVASTTLHDVLKSKGTEFRTEKATVTLADGLRRRQSVKTATVPVTLCGRTIPTNFIVLPETHDNRTLLGVDFIQDAGIVLNLPQLLFHFLEEPARKYDLYNEEEVDVSVATVQTAPLEVESVISRLAKITSLEPMLSPLPMTPAPSTYVPEECSMADSYGPPPLIEFYTPPQSPSRPEPTLSGYSPRFVGALFRDAQSSINGAEITLSPHSQQLFGTAGTDIATVAVPVPKD
uniref:CCHC-type domain-containing protein n=1 Tax=Heliothis virescens TaxID=7102 RepID=A0A2A4K4E5_HELVI